MIDWLIDAYNDLAEWFVALFDAIISFLSDLPIYLLDGLLGAIASLIEAIPIPDLLSNGLSPLFAQLDPSIAYFLMRSGLPEMLAMIGAAYLFRLSRKALTLFQW